MKIIVFYQGLEPTSLILSQFNVKDLSELRVPTLKYKDLLLDRLQVKEEYQVIFWNRKIESFRQIHKYIKEKLSYQDLISSPEDFVTFYDISNFPTQEKAISIIQKITYSDSLALCYYTQNDLKFFSGIMGLPFSLLEDFSKQNIDFTQNSSEKSLNIDITEYFLRLDEPSAIFSMFISNFQLRYFNSIRENGPYFEKTSTKMDKLKDEYAFLKDVPVQLRPFYPHVGNGFEKDHSYTYEIEKIYSFDASKLFINNVFFEEKNIDILLKKLELYFKATPKKSTSKENYIQKVESVLIQKNRQRLKELKDCPHYIDLNNIAKKALGYDLDEYTEKINKSLESGFKSISDYSFYFSHGDLCLPNILFDIQTGALKLIDPRGGENFSEMIIYYDLGKLSHSLLGHYDFIVSDLFSVQLSDDLSPCIKIDIPSDKLEMIENKFKTFTENLGFSYSIIRLVEASLFLSMLPLHQDKPKRMVAELLRSVEIYQQLGEQNGN